MHEELERVGRLRKSLEPLAVLYEKAVLEARKEPYEVRLTTQQSPDHLSDTYDGGHTVHIIDGESLWAVYQVWQEYRQIERELLAKTGEPLVDSLTYLSAPEREWLVWFYHLSDEDKKVVEECGERDITVTADNLEQMKRTVRKHSLPA
jgi:hypothetical protein